MKGSVDAVHKLSGRKWVYSSGSWSRYKKKKTTPPHSPGVSSFCTSRLHNCGSGSEAAKTIKWNEAIKEITLLNKSTSVSSPLSTKNDEKRCLGCVGRPRWLQNWTSAHRYRELCWHTQEDKQWGEGILVLLMNLLRRPTSQFSPQARSFPFSLL